MRPPRRERRSHPVGGVAHGTAARRPRRRARGRPAA
jgi:hypothetical protein